jgi:hypothetical protein
MSQEWNSGTGSGAGAARSSGGVSGPRVVTLNMASQLADYLMRAQELGAMEQGDGGMEMRGDVMDALRALHEVLAGGRVEVKVVQRGHPDIARELNRRIVSAQEEANAINKAAGFYLGMSV